MNTHTQSLPTTRPCMPDAAAHPFTLWAGGEVRILIENFTIYCLGNLIYITCPPYAELDVEGGRSV